MPALHPLMQLCSATLCASISQHTFRFATRQRVSPTVCSLAIVQAPGALHRPAHETRQTPAICSGRSVPMQLTALLMHRTQGMSCVSSESVEFKLVIQERASTDKTPPKTAKLASWLRVDGRQQSENGEPHTKLLQIRQCSLGGHSPPVWCQESLSQPASAAASDMGSRLPWAQTQGRSPAPCSTALPHLQASSRHTPPQLLEESIM